MQSMNKSNNWSMTSTNALNNAKEVTRMELDRVLFLAQHLQEYVDQARDYDPVTRVNELYAEFLSLHTGGGSEGQAVKEVAKAFQGSRVVDEQPAQPQSGGNGKPSAGSITLRYGFEGKYQDMTLQQVWDVDPDAIRRMTAGKNDFLRKVSAEFLSQVA